MDKLIESVEVPCVYGIDNPMALGIIVCPCENRGAFPLDLAMASINKGTAAAVPRSKYSGSVELAA